MAKKYRDLALILLGVISIGIMEIFGMGKNPEADYQKARLAMVENQIRERGIEDPNVLKAMATVPRHLFVPDFIRAQAYNDHPLPIGEGQTISQPYIVALMTEALAVKKGDKVLEVGTGSGYQAAILAQMGCKVYSLEIVPQLAKSAQKTLQDLGYKSVSVVAQNGSIGYPTAAPYDGIIVTAAAVRIPPPLTEQLKIGGCLVIPVGKQGEVQELLKIVREETGFKTYSLGAVLFVPLIEKENK